MKCLWIWILMSVSLHAGPPRFEFANAHDSEGWTKGNDVGEFRMSAEGLVIPITGADPYLIGPRGNYVAPKGLLLTARVKSPVAGWGQVFFFQEHSREE